MNNKVTKYTQPYPKGYEPDYLLPSEYCDYRFAIGKKGKNPLVAICMNPSAARDESSDRTINRIIDVSKKLEMDGWIVFNTYPERATDAKNIKCFDENLSNKNIELIRDFLLENNITEVWGAWGDDKNNTALVKGKSQLMLMLKTINVKVFYFSTLTKANNPRHPLQRFEKHEFTHQSKMYMEKVVLDSYIYN